MQALYQLSYSPLDAVADLSGVRTCRQRLVSVQDLSASPVVAEHRLRQGSGVVLQQARLVAAAAQNRPGAVRQRTDCSPEFFGEAEHPRGAQPARRAVVPRARARSEEKIASGRSAASSRAARSACCSATESSGMSLWP